MDLYIPLSVPNLKGKELEYVTHAIESEWVSTAGPYIPEFEAKMAEYVGAEEAVACQSGTAGLHLALQVCGVARGDEVIVPTLTFIASVNPIKYLGAEPVFMDCDDSLTMEVNKLYDFCEKECTFDGKVLINKLSGRRVKAIVIVHVFGNMADMERFKDITDKYNLRVIEDSTEALGTYYTEGKYKGLHAGMIGDIGVYSFNGNKIITTGGGGMIVSKNKDVLEKCRYLSTQAKNDVLYFVHDEVGYNYRMTNIQAALGIAQLEQLEGFIKVKHDNYNEYIKKGIELLSFRKGTRPNYWFYTYMTRDRDSLMKYLGQNGIQVRPIWKLNHTQTPYAQNQAYRIEKALYYYDNVLNLPCSTNLLNEHVQRVVEAITAYRV